MSPTRQNVIQKRGDLGGFDLSAETKAGQIVSLLAPGERPVAAEGPDPP